MKDFQYTLDLSFGDERHAKIGIEFFRLEVWRTQKICLVLT